MLLDVGAASGDVATHLKQVLARRGLQVEVTLADRCWTHFSNGSDGQSRRVVADAMALPFASLSFDVVSCGLLLHHFEPQQVRNFLSEAMRVSRVAVLISDLRRNALSLALTKRAVPFYRSRLTRHDAPASVRQAYTMEEMKAMLPPGARAEVRPYYFFRMGVILWK